MRLDDKSKMTTEYVVLGGCNGVIVLQEHERAAYFKGVATFAVVAAIFALLYLPFMVLLLL